MGKLIIYLFSLFILIWAMYGLAQGVMLVHNGIARFFTPSPKPQASPQFNEADAIPLSQLLEGPSSPKRDPSPSTASTPQHYLHELKTLHELHQAGALNAEEFSQLKQHLLSTLQKP